MRTAIMLAVLLSGCTVANSPRMRFAGSSTSLKSVDDLAGCIALKLSQNRGLSLATSTIANGKRLSLTLPVSGMKFVQQTVDVQDLGDTRRVSAQQLLADIPAGSEIQGPISSCL